ncbi:MAG: methylated-DNA--[protein]-cysteine S-methyltransferase [Saprospiraceae bacterium]|nr:methylated-DNA--[protein]-cysteine S-methyltransferase [Saprospiraceae bacterium]
MQLETVFLPTPIGLFRIIGSELGVRSVKLSPKQNEYEFNDLPDDHPVAICCKQLEEYFTGKRETFEIKLDWSGEPDFHQKVWGELVKIPFGKTVSYSDIAERVGNPAAVRAVGLANRNNPIAIIVPCHRVIGKAGELRGYFYGLDTKEQLLRHENPVRFAQQGTLF